MAVFTRRRHEPAERSFGNKRAPPSALPAYMNRSRWRDRRPIPRGTDSYRRRGSARFDRVFIEARCAGESSRWSSYFLHSLALARPCTSCGSLIWRLKRRVEPYDSSSACDGGRASSSSGVPTHDAIGAPGRHSVVDPAPSFRNSGFDTDAKSVLARPHRARGRPSVLPRPLQTLSAPWPTRHRLYRLDHLEGHRVAPMFGPPRARS